VFETSNPSSPPSPARRGDATNRRPLPCLLPAGPSSTPHPLVGGAARVHRQQPTPSVNFLPLLPDLTPSPNPPVLLPKRSTPALRRNSTFSSYPRRSRPPSGEEIHPNLGLISSSAACYRLENLLLAEARYCCETEFC